MRVGYLGADAESAGGGFLWWGCREPDERVVDGEMDRIVDVCIQAVGW
jgi:hypothetical protein